MERIIQQILREYTKIIMEKIFSGGLHDIGTLTEDLSDCCKSATLQLLETVITECNEQFRNDKDGRKEKGLVLKEKNRKRSIYTSLGTLNLNRDCYYDKINGQYVFPMDIIFGITPYERISRSVAVNLVNCAAEHSYAKSAEIVTGNDVSRQSVRNQILKVEVPDEKIPTVKKNVRELFVYADEDHVHLQKEKKQRGKQNQIVPVVTVTEGIRKVGIRRSETINPKRFVDKKMSSKGIWKSVEGYIAGNYDTESIEHIYVYGDGGQWIKKGLSGYRQTIHVMDGYHFAKWLKQVSKSYPTRNVRAVIRNAVRANDKKKAMQFLRSLMNEASAKEESQEKEAEKKLKSLIEFQTYLLGNWEAIHNLLTLPIPGSCTEGQVSHILSARFSRGPMGWSKKGLSKLSGIRVSGLNGRKIECGDFECKDKRKKVVSYADYLDSWMEESIQGAFDWSIFEGEPDVFDSTAGVQVLMRAYGINHGIAS